jgi:arsenate reductase (thioredoxin)
MVPGETSGPPVVVFVCIQNAGRSQMAEALFNRAAGGRALARSAGSRPADEVHPIVAQAMEEIGIDISAAKPKGLGADVLDGVDWVVGMGCGDECPFVPGAKRLDWEVADPSGQSLNEVRGIRNDVKRLVDLLLADVVG